MNKVKKREKPSTNCGYKSSIINRVKQKKNLVQIVDVNQILQVNLKKRET